MKKSKLQKLLDTIPNDPDILLWNGFVGDWQDISHKISESVLVKQTLEEYIDRNRFQRARDRNDIDYKLTQEEISGLTKSYKKYIKWEDNEFVTEDDVSKGYYKTKPVYYLQPKLMDKTGFDRLGKLTY